MVEFDFYDPTKNVSDNVDDKLKLSALERLIKNIYHCKEIVYDIQFLTESGENAENYPENIWGVIYLVGLNDDPLKAPKLHDCCDDGLNYEISGKIVKADDFLERENYLEIQHILEVWFNNSYKLKLERLTKNKK